MKLLTLKPLMILIAIFAINPIFANSKDIKFNILPLPQKMEITKNNVLKSSDLKYIISENAPMPILGSILNGMPRYNKSGKGVVLNITDIDVPESEEGYVLKISKEGVVINARSEVGLFYGCTTLEQMLEDCRDFGLQLPATVITDYPSIPFRSVHFDTKHHLGRIEYYYSVIDKLATYKINAIIWEIEDKLRFTRRPEVGASNAISKQEMQAISRYAKDRHIEINPLVQGLGHAGFILKHHWELRETESSDWEFCPSDPKTYEVQFDLYRDAMEAMPYSKYLHIGGDEIHGIGVDARCKATGKTPFELQMIWLKKVCDFAIENGKIPIFWDDMPLKYAGIWGLLHNGLSDEEIEKQWNTDKLDEAVELFPKNCIYMRWQYGDPTGLAHLKTLEWFKNKGLQVMAATAASDGGCPFMPRDDSRALNIKLFSTLVVENNLVGILATAWDDGSPHWETIIRGLIAQGEYGWNPKGRDVESFKSAHAQREFGFTNNEESFLNNLEDFAFFFDGALIVSGRRNPSWQVRDYKLMNLPNDKSLGEWSKTYADKIKEAKHMDSIYHEICKGIDIAKKHALRNRYTLDVYEQTNELFHYPVKLLLALEAYDNATGEENKNIATQNLKKVCADFTDMRTKLEDVYSKVRFMNASDGYIADNNHHNHLSALSLNSDWLYLYELPMINKIMRWLK